MAMKRILWTLAGLLAGTWALKSQVLPTPPRQQGQPITRSIAASIALHDAKSRQFNANCLASGCHADIFNRTSLNSSIPPAHNLVAQMGIPATQCAFCHESTEIVRGLEKGRGNAGKLGKNVDAGRKCYPCHGPYGPAKKLYPR
jgi:hypothetical protein